MTRRDFIKTMSLLSGAVLAPVRWLGKWAGVEPAQEEEPAVGELYAGFVLLPEDAPVPAFVSPPKLPDIDRCGLTEGGSAPERTAEIEYLDDFTEAKRKLDFPLYDFTNLPDGLRRCKPYIARDDLGNVYGVLLYYETPLSTDIWATTLSIWIQPDFSRPFPLWKSESVEPNGPAVILEKVNLHPAPGIKISTQEGFIYYWIESDTLYRLVAEPSPTGQDAQALVNLLELQ